MNFNTSLSLIVTKYKQEILMLNNTVNQMYLADIHRTSHTKLRNSQQSTQQFFKTGHILG